MAIVRATVGRVPRLRSRLLLRHPDHLLTDFDIRPAQLSRPGVLSTHAGRLDAEILAFGTADTTGNAVSATMYTTPKGLTKTSQSAIGTSTAGHERSECESLMSFPLITFRRLSLLL